MKSSTVWHGHSTRPSLPAGTARKASGSLPRGRRNRLIIPPAKRNRAFPTGNALLYISLSSVAFGRVRPGGAPCFCFALFSLVPQFFFRCPQTVSAGDHLGHPERKPRPVDAHGADEQPQAGHQHHQLPQGTADHVDHAVAKAGGKVAAQDRDDREQEGHRDDAQGGPL